MTPEQMKTLAERAESLLTLPSDKFIGTNHILNIIRGFDEVEHVIPNCIDTAIINLRLPSVTFK